MSLYPNKTEQGLINLAELAQHQNYQKATKIISRILKETYDKQLAESYEPVTKNLMEVNKSTKKTGESV